MTRRPALHTAWGAAAWLALALLLAPPAAWAAKGGSTQIIIGGKPAAEAQATRLIILSGQSNMAHLNITNTLVPTFEAAFPDDALVFVKHSQAGQSIRRWYKGWKDQETPDPARNVPHGEIGDLYTALMGMVAANAAGRTFASVSFIWMQGESDGIPVNGGRPDLYEEALTGLLKQLRDDLQRPDLTAVIGRINNNRSKGERPNPRWIAVREAQVKVAEADPLAAWVDCDPFGDGLHYQPDGYAAMGKAFAEKAIELIRNQEKNAD